MLYNSLWFIHIHKAIHLYHFHVIYCAPTVCISCYVSFVTSVPDEGRTVREILESILTQLITQEVLVHYDKISLFKLNLSKQNTFQFIAMFWLFSVFSRSWVSELSLWIYTVFLFLCQDCMFCIHCICEVHVNKTSATGSSMFSSCWPGVWGRPFHAVHIVPLFVEIIYFI